MAFIRSISGLRATVGDALTPSLVAQYAAGFASYLPQGAIAVGRDGRPSGKWIRQVVCGTLMACGRQVISLGMAPTPTVQLFAEQEGVAGGISISASHNPAEWNGMKFFNRRGLYLNAEENADFWRIVDAQTFHTADYTSLGAIVDNGDPDSQHIGAIFTLPVFQQPQNLDAMRRRRLRVVVDAVHASGSYIVPKLLEALGCEVIALYCDGTGIFPHTPEPLPEHLTALSHSVREHRADVGIAVDPDADRLVLVDERGCTVREEYTIALATLAVLKNAQYFGFAHNTDQQTTSATQPTVVINLSTTRTVEDLAAQYNARVLRTPVGEINVVNAMLAHGAVIGGEGSGGVILPACHAGRDALVGSALVVLLLAQSGMTLAECIASLPQYAMVKHKYPVGGSLHDTFEKVRALFPQALVNTDDGLRLQFGREFGNAWLHLRSSNTEPIIRIIAEAPSEAQAQELCDKCSTAL
jgi:phosphomannomutase